MQRLMLEPRGFKSSCAQHDLRPVRSNSSAGLSKASCSSWSRSQSLPPMIYLYAENRGQGFGRRVNEGRTEAAYGGCITVLVSGATRIREYFRIQGSVFSNGVPEWCKFPS